jgi:RecA/RadA recombinase
MSLKDKLLKNSTIKQTAVLSESRILDDRTIVSTSIPAMNIAFSGDVDGGFGPGITTWAGPSKHFKTVFSLIMAKAYLDKFPEGMLLFYDSEFGSNNYFDSVGIDRDRVIHTPITDIEGLRSDLSNQIAELEKKDKLIIVIDSIGNLASKKETEDAMDQKSAADFTRSKILKSLFRIVTPHLTLKDIPMIVINHTYKTMEMFSKDVLGGGSGNVYASDNIYILGRQQDKDGTELSGYKFIINVEKSRYSKEKSKIPVEVSFDRGVEKYSGILEMALESGDVVKPKNGWYQLVDRSTGELIGKSYREAETKSKEFLGVVLQRQEFKDWVKKTYQLAHTSIMADEDVAAAFPTEDEEISL